MTRSTAPVADGTGPTPMPVPPATAPPAITWWAALGAAVIAFQVFVWTRWFTTGNATPVPVGPTPIPDWMKAVLIAGQIAGPVMLLVCAYIFLVKPWREGRGFTLDGMLFVVWFCMFFQDPMLNFFQVQATYNSYLVNLGAWTTDAFPGWISPGGRFMAEPLLFIPATYACALFPLTILGCKLMRVLQSRRPGLSVPSLLIATAIVLAVLDLIMEGLIFIPLGFYTFGGAIKGWTMFYGEYYQFPVYHAAFIGMWLSAMTALRYFRDDRGNTVAERGIDKLKVSGARAATLRFLALFGAAALSFALYNVPIQFAGMHADPWPDKILERSYFSSQMCGPGTDYACPGDAVPIQKAGAVHVRPDGTIGVPPGVELPGVELPHAVAVKQHPW